MGLSTADKRARFRALHADGFFILPNPWDCGSAHAFAQLGFEALATTSSGAAQALGRSDYELTLDEVLSHLKVMARATELPLNADFENGFADAPQDIAANVRLAVLTGVAGLSIEDRQGDRLYPAELAVERVYAARQAIDAVDPAVVLVARTEACLLGETSVRPVIERMTAMAAAGADCLYAPGLTTLSDIRDLVQAVAPKPVNVLLKPGLELTNLRAAGVRRASTGGALASLAYDAATTAARALAEEEMRAHA